MRLILVFLTIFAPLGALAEVTYAKSIDVIDFFVDRDDWKGRRLTVTSCHIVIANADQIGCRAAGTSSIFYIDGKSLDREGLRRSMRLCAGFDDTPDCEADVSGLVATVLASTGLMDASIKWRRP